ncbi:hypothetical protein RIF29_00242 [Crotalaria pallida]|uniref:Uncharacterized protein n=1 Tax=Crotalaria pallida TaxID=3830 RepID=A0AAN9IWB7_CROPI
MANYSEIVDSGYSCPKSINLRIDFEDGVVLDDNNEVIFRMEKQFSHRRRRVLLDAASSKSICILHKKPPPSPCPIAHHNPAPASNATTTKTNAVHDGNTPHLVLIPCHPLVPP